MTIGDLADKLYEEDATVKLIVAKLTELDDAEINSVYNIVTGLVLLKEKCEQDGWGD